DIAGALWHLLKHTSGGIFNVTDDLPAPPQDVVTYAAGLMGVTPPPEIPFETAQLSPMARSFYGENKRVANTAIKAAGYRFRFPDYRRAFDHMWVLGNWRDGEARSPMKRS
ncbi:MAG: NAD(P)-dependent oxidoreductase, partial [Mesorhizobium sp.]